jgi:hypothetical protein
LVSEDGREADPLDPFEQSVWLRGFMTKFAADLENRDSSALLALKYQTFGAQANYQWLSASG